MTNAERFIDAYARIEKELNQIARETKYIPFSQLLYKCAKSNQIVSINQQSLYEYNQLRNAIVHQRGKENEIIAEPSDSVTDDIERIANLLQMDDSIMNFVSAPVQTVTSYDSFVDIYRLMKELRTSKIPVYDEGKYTGIITIEAIAEKAVSHNMDNIKGSELIEHDKNSRVLFLGKSNSISNVVHGFENAMKNGSSLLAVIVTKKGSMDEEPLGIITTADLPGILATMI